MFAVNQRVVINRNIVAGVSNGRNYGPPTLNELESLVGQPATIREVLRAGYAIEIDGREGLFPVYQEEIDAL